MESDKPLTVDTMNPCIRELEYAVRGKVLLEALKIKEELEQVYSRAKCLLNVLV